MLSEDIKCFVRKIVHKLCMEDGNNVRSMRYDKYDKVRSMIRASFPTDFSESVSKKLMSASTSHHKASKKPGPKSKVENFDKQKVHSSN